MNIVSSSTSQEKHIDVNELLESANSYYGVNVNSNRFDAKTQAILTTWSRCAINRAASQREQAALDPVFNTINNEKLDDKNLMLSLIVKKNFKDFVVDSLKRYHALHDITSLLPKCLNLSAQVLSISSSLIADFTALTKIVRSITTRLIIIAVVESMNENSQRYLGNFIMENDLPIPLSYYVFKVDQKKMEYVINFNLITELLCLTDNRMILQIGSSSAVGQGKSSLLPYMCSDKREESVNTSGSSSLRAGCIDLLFGTVKFEDVPEHRYTIFDVHGTIETDLNRDLILSIKYHASLIILCITPDDLEPGSSPSLFSDVQGKSIIVVVFDSDFDDHDAEGMTTFLNECRDKLKRYFSSTMESHFHVVVAPSASLWTQRSDNREFDEQNRAQLLRQSFTNVFAQLEPTFNRTEPVCRSSFMIQSLYSSLRQGREKPKYIQSSFEVEERLKSLLHGYTDETDNLLKATPISYLEGRIRALDKQAQQDLHDNRELAKVRINQSINQSNEAEDALYRLKTQLGSITCVSPLTSLFIELLTRRTFVELLIVEKYLEKWRLQYQPKLQSVMSKVKQDAIRYMNIVKHCEAEEHELNKESSTNASKASKRSQIREQLQSARANFAKSHKDMEALEKKLMNIDLTVGLFLDEIMAIAKFNRILLDPEQSGNIIHRLAVCFVDLMNRGIALHILRGRPLECDSPLLLESIRLAGVNARSTPCVVSVIGEQSSAKSSLLNTCFGTNFRVSSGRCTIGIYVSVVHWDTLTVVLLDTEGLLSVEEASSLFDNQIVTMAMLSSHLTIINHKGEFSTTLGSLIGTFLYAKSRVGSEFKPTLQFILRDQSDTSNQAKEKYFFPQLAALKQNLQSDAKFLTVSVDEMMDINSNAVTLLSNAIVRDFDKKTYVIHTYRNRRFPNEILELRSTIYASLTNSVKQNVYTDFDNLALTLTSNWKVIDILGPDLLSLKTLVELQRAMEVQTVAVNILQAKTASLHAQFRKLVEDYLQSLSSKKMTIEIMKSTQANFQKDINATLENIRSEAIEAFEHQTNKSYFPTDVKEKWKRTIASSLKSLGEEWIHMFDERLQSTCHERVAVEMKDALMKRAEDRFRDLKSLNVDQLRRTMKDEIETLRAASQKQQAELFDQPTVIREKMIGLYNRCLRVHKNKSDRKIYDLLPQMTLSNFDGYCRNLEVHLPRLDDFLRSTRNRSVWDRIRAMVSNENEFEKMWSTVKDEVHWPKSSDAKENHQIIHGILVMVVPQLESSMIELASNDYPVYKKLKSMESLIVSIEKAMEMPEIANHKNKLNPPLLAVDMATLCLRRLIEESIRIAQDEQKSRLRELQERIEKLQHSVERQIAVMADASKQGKELANTVGLALFDELQKIMVLRVKDDIRQAVVDSDFIAYENIPAIAYTNSITMGNAENILKYITDINRYFLELSLNSIRHVFNAVLSRETSKLGDLMNQLLFDIDNEVQSNECKNYSEVNRAIEERVQESFYQRIKGGTGVNFRFPRALSVAIGNSNLFKSAFREIRYFSAQVPQKVESIIEAIRKDAFKECVRSIKQKLGCDQRCPGCGAKCAVVGAHDQKIITRMPRPGHPLPDDADRAVLIHTTNHHLAPCLHGAGCHSTKQPVLAKCYQNWQSSGIHITDEEVVRPLALYYNHFHPSWFNNLDKLANVASDCQQQHAGPDQRRAWMLVRRVICHRSGLNDYSDAEYKKFPENYPLIDPLPIDFEIHWEDDSF